MASSFAKFLKRIKLLPGLQVRIVVLNGAASNTGTGGIPYVLTGSLVAAIDDRLQYAPFPYPQPPVEVETDDDDFLVLDLGTAEVTVLAPGTSGANPTFITLSGIIAVNLNCIQIIAPVTPI
jgi:hypothetical protein